MVYAPKLNDTLDRSKPTWNTNIIKIELCSFKLIAKLRKPGFAGYTSTCTLCYSEPRLQKQTVNNGGRVENEGEACVRCLRECVIYNGHLD